MEPSDKKRYIPAYFYTTGDPEEHPHLEFIEVSEEVYQAYYRQIWQIREHARRKGGCSTADWKKCIGDCGTCLYQVASSSHTSYEDLLDCEEKEPSLELADIAEQVYSEMMRSELAKGIAALNEEEQFICHAVAAGLTERESARQLGLSKTTYHDHKERLFQRLKTDWLDFI